MQQKAPKEHDYELYFKFWEDCGRSIFWQKNNKYVEHVEFGIPVG